MGGPIYARILDKRRAKAVNGLVKRTLKGTGLISIREKFNIKVYCFPYFFTCPIIKVDSENNKCELLNNKYIDVSEEIKSKYKFVLGCNLVD